MKNKILTTLAFSIFIALILAILGLSNCSSKPANEVEVTNNSTNVQNIISHKPIEKAPIKNYVRDEKLQKEADKLLNLFDKMPSVPFYVKDEPIMKSGNNVEKGVAYTICENKNQPTVYVKKVFYQKANQKQLVNIVKHELVHAWFCRQGVQVAHDLPFQKKFKEVGGFGN